MSAWRITVGIGALLTVALWRGWFDPFHLVIGGTACGVAIAFILWWRRSRREVGEDEAAAPEEDREGPLRAAVLGLLGGLTLSLALAGVFAGAGRIDPLVARFRDGDRQAFEARLDQSAQAGNDPEGIRLLEQRLRRGKLSRAWQADLTRRLYEAYLAAARGAMAPEGRTDLLQKAVALAQATGLNSRAAADALQREQERGAARVALEEYKKSRQWLKLVASLEFLSTAKPRAEWEVPADGWLYDAYLEWAKDSTNLEVKAEKLQFALKVAADRGLDGASARAILAATEAQKAVEEQIRLAENRAQAQAQGEVKSLEKKLDEAAQARQREQATAADQLKRQAAEAAARLERVTREERYRGLLQAGDSVAGSDPLPVLEQQVRLYTQARDFAQANGLEPQAATQRLNKAKSDRTALLARLARESRPADLAPGTQVRIARAGTDRFPPSIDLEVAVEDAQGRPIRALAPKDFRLTCGAELSRRFELAPVRSHPPSLYVVVAVDGSGSMTGKPITAAIAGAQAMIRGLADEAEVHVQILVFGSQVQLRCPWTTDLAKAAAALEGITASGPTALFAAVETALRDLATCVGERRLVVFTDGRDTQSPRGFRLADLTGHLRKNAVSVSAIGLETKELDRDTLQQLAAQSGGAYFHATAPGDIAARFVEARRQLHREFYRFVLTPTLSPDTNSFDLRIEVGGANKVAAQTTVRTDANSFTAKR